MKTNTLDEAKLREILEHAGYEFERDHNTTEGIIKELIADINALAAEAVVAELERWRTMVQRLSAYVDHSDSLIEFDDRIALLKQKEKL